jgi:hypothetical protein
MSAQMLQVPHVKRSGLYCALLDRKAAGRIRHRYRGWTADEKIVVANNLEDHPIAPRCVCTENLNTGVVVMKSAQDGA